MIYSGDEMAVPSVDILTLLFDHPSSRADEDTALHAEAHHPHAVISKSRARHLTRSIAYFLRHAYGIGEDIYGDFRSPTRTGDAVVCVSTGQSALACLLFGVVGAGGVYSAASAASTAADVARQICDVVGEQQEQANTQQDQANTQHDPEKQGNAQETTDAKAGRKVVLVCSRDCVDLVENAARDAGVPRRRVLVLESWPQVVLRSLDGAEECDFGIGMDWWRSHDADELARRTACLVYSSGTTGLPKGVLISHTNLVHQVFASAHISAVPTWTRTLAHLPTAHIAGLLSYFLRSMYQGTLVYWMRAFSLPELVDRVDALAVSALFTVPPVWAALAKDASASIDKDSSRAGIKKDSSMAGIRKDSSGSRGSSMKKDSSGSGIKNKLATIRYASAGAAPMGEHTQRAVGDMLGGVVATQVYGLSETTGGITYVPPERKADAVGSCGVLMPNCRMRLVDDDGADVPRGQPGEALFRGPIITRGYHHDPSANAASFTPDGWFRSGDIIRIDPSGLVYIVDRKKELIKYKGLQVAPAELENILIAHPAVRDAAVIPFASRGTELPRAYVALETPPQSISTADSITTGPANTALAADLADYVARRVAPFKRLRGGIVFVDSIPRSPSGKILRRQLRHLQKREEKAESAKI